MAGMQLDASPGPLHAGTILAGNYLAQAQVLVDSFRRHHPDGTFHILFVGDPGEEAPVIPGAEVITLDELVISPADLERLTVAYDLLELATALKPWFLAHLLGLGLDHAAYFDADISIERRIDELPDLARSSSVVLTPHLTEPMPLDGGLPNEQSILLAGSYNAGFLAVGATPEARRMLEWWSSRLLSCAYVDVARGLFSDQRSVDFVPGLFEHTLVKDPSWNVAYWNLATRPLRREEDGTLTVAGRPLTFVHYSGYSPLVPHLLSRHQGPEPRVRLSENEVLREVCEDYRRRLLAAGYVEHQRRPAPFAEVGGVRIGPLVRALVRDEVGPGGRGVASTRLAWRGQEGLRLGAWLDEPAEDGFLPFLGRYLREPFLRRRDLQEAYPEVRGGVLDRYLEWCEVFGIEEEDLCPERVRVGRERARRRRGIDYAPGALLSRPTERLRDTRSVHGVEVAGYLSAEVGLGEAGRQFVASLEGAGVPVSTTTWARTLSRKAVPWEDRSPAPGERHDTALLCLNADMLPRFHAEVGRSYLRRRYRIGLWFWELDDYPPAMREAVDMLDEVWVCSEFNAQALRPHTSKPVVVMPLPAHAPNLVTSAIEEVPNDDRYTFLFVFDYLSIYQRKNPVGVVEAFRRAFPEVGQARLVIKSINGDRRTGDREELRYLVADRPDIVLIERYLTRRELDALMHRADCYVSLHRSEGFGQTLAEMMAIGKPVVATAYSGSMEFTRPDNCFLVGYDLVAVPPGCEPYPVTAQWAEPHVDEAAQHLRTLAQHPALGLAKGRQAAVRIAEGHSTAALGAAARARLEEIWASRRFARRTRPAGSPARAARAVVDAT